MVSTPRKIWYHLAMVSISIELTEEDVERLKARANSLAIPLEQLAAAVIHEELNAGDTSFEALAKRVVDKNRGLYSRLA